MGRKRALRTENLQERISMQQAWRRVPCDARALLGPPLQAACAANDVLETDRRTETFGLDPGGTRENRASAAEGSRIAVRCTIRLARPRRRNPRRKTGRLLAAPPVLASARLATFLRATGTELRRVAAPSLRQGSCLLEKAGVRRYDGVATTIADLDVVGRPVKATVARGVPVITFNSGTAKQSESLGALMHIGQPEHGDCRGGRSRGGARRAAGTGQSDRDTYAWENQTIPW
ncbi:hypothetical protein SAMN05414139_10457 [Burkholderia sp. D7]|nr:hypothetical protein SAMN05414139_10457 [Burkholderia sp. D7]